jgi:licheninase
MNLVGRSLSAAAVLPLGVVAVVAAMLCCELPQTSLVPSVGAQPSDSGCAATAAATYGWGTPNRSTDFNGLGGWGIYDGPGHNGNGRRTPDAVSVSNGVLTIAGDAAGDSGGMAWYPGQKYGRWEVCSMATPAAATYHAVLLLWPDDGDWPESGEIDFMETSDPSRQGVSGFLHYGAQNNQKSGSTRIDATKWHSWAVEWTPDHLAMFVDGRQWWRTTSREALPPGAMHLCMQLDNFGGDTSRGGAMMVDWARQYSL